MAETNGTDKQKTGILDRLPRLSRVSRLVLLVGLFLIVLIPVVMIQNSEKARQTDYQQQILVLQKILAVPADQTTTLEEDVRRAELNLALTSEKFPAKSQSTKIIDEILKLAKLSYVEITKVTTSTGEQVVSVGTTKVNYPLLICSLSLQGDSANFQNYLYELNKLDTCRIISISITMAANEADNDSATLNLEILLQG